MRVKFYREHKYVSARLNNLERMLATLDFCDVLQVKKAKEEWDELCFMLEEHAKYEEERIHVLLEKKGSKIHLETHEEHEKMKQQFFMINALWDRALPEKDEEALLEIGYQIYLAFRNFVAENLLHLHKEETQILPEIQRLYSDEELRFVEAPTYDAMTPEEILGMLKELFPYMNRSDKEAFLEDIEFLQTEKLQKIAKDVSALM